MARFFVVPSRPSLGRRFGFFLNHLLPGLDWPAADWAGLAETLGAAMTEQEGIYLVYREDLGSEDVACSLRRDFGASMGDEVVEVSEGAPPRRWLLPVI